MNATEQRFQDNVSALEQLKGSSPELIKHSKEYEHHNGRRSDTCFKKVHVVPDIGDSIGELTVTGYVVGTSGGLKALIVNCSCGSPEFTVLPNNVRKGKTKRCIVCSKVQTNKSRKKFWGYVDILEDDNHRFRLLSRISAALQRCHNPNDKNYPNYGGRGIHVFEPWRNGTEGRRGFLAHLITLDGWDIPNYDMDRIDTDKGYEPGNIRFVTRSQNAYNKRKVQTLQSSCDEREVYIIQLEERVSELESEVRWLRDAVDGHSFA
jgi:hypothetical protein